MARLLVGLSLGIALGAGIVLVGQEPTVTVKNGILEGWTVVRDDETVLCENPMIFVRARQIECP